MPDLPATSLIPATQSLHGPHLERSVPGWLREATPPRRAALKDSPAPVPEWYRQASAAQRKTLGDSVVQSFSAQTRLDHAMASLQDIDAFAAPLLVKALQDQFNVTLDVQRTLLCLKKPIEASLFAIDVGSFEVLRLPLLQAALHNFEASEAEPGAFHASSGFLSETTAGQFADADTALTVSQFTTLCRSLDIGARYQTYLNDFLQAKGSVADQVLQEKFTQAQKTALRAAAELALLQNDIRPDDYRMILAVIEGDLHPSVGGRPVWFHDLSLMKHRMTGCIVFDICEKYRYSDDLILYIPHAPHQPLKRYTKAQMQTWFKQQFTTRAADDPTDGSPTGYQRFFSQFVAYADRADYFSQLTSAAPAASVVGALAPYAPLVNELLKGVSSLSAVTGIKTLPPVAPAPRIANLDPFLAPAGITRKGHGIWAANIDLWAYRYDQHRDKLLADARSHAVPTADVDARVRSEKLARLLNIGMLLLNTVSMFVPVLGEVMMGVMVAQLLEETLAGAVEWSEGDRRKATAHLVDVAENLAFLAVMAGVGKALGRLATAPPEPLIERLDPVTLPSGQTRLWRPDLRGYESPVTLPADAAPNALGEYLHEGKSYIRQSGKVYEKTFDPALKRWRIQHPSDPDAYQPPLSHNGAGAWRHSLERPQTWDRLTLMQRLGPVTERFSDEQLLQIADISGTDDNLLRQMHVDNLPPPASLADTLRLFKADADVAQVIEQVSSGRALDGRYLYTLPLVTELPRWPVGRVLEVFEVADLSGRPQRYGSERLFHGVKLKPPIRISRAEVLSGQLPTKILAALDESEVTRLLGGEAARVRENRPLELRKQLADHARSRQPALFDSLYTGTDMPDPTLAKLQRLYPGLSEPAARSVIAQADAEQLIRLRDSGRVPLAMQEHARWQVRQGRVGRAFAGLHMERLVSADSKRLALHTLSRLPGWPDTLRVEIREGDTSGPLLDSIGSPNAAERKYLVKRGPYFQAFDARGEALNSLPSHGDNFYASLMHALPDDARRSLGLPHVGQSLQLRQAIIKHASAHRLQSVQLVEGQGRRPSWFKPPQRLAQQRLGYPASGGREDIARLLASRVQDVYPHLTDIQAHQFILDRIVDGLSDPQIFTLLNNRLREWQALEATLEEWVLAPADDPFIRRYPQLDARPAMAQALRNSWRNAPLAEQPRAASLTLIGDTPLPLLEADFSHVRSLTLRGRLLIESQVEVLLERFPNVHSLTLAGSDSALNSVPLALEHLHGLTDLTIETSANLEEPQLARLEGLSGLQALNLHTSMLPARAIEFSHFPALRRLTLSGPGQRVFPEGVMALPLERLNLQHSAIDSLPPAMLAPGKESLWSVMSLSWSRFSREHFRAAYDFVRNQPMHLMDQDQMVREYASGQLHSGFGRPRQLTIEPFGQLTSNFLKHWPSTQARFDAIEALSSEYGALSAQLDTWQAPGVRQADGYSRATIAAALRQSWHQGLLMRYGISQTAVLNLPDLLVLDLPLLPAEGFAHVTVLRAPNAQVSSASMSAFIRGFQGLQTLDVRAGRLSELKVLPGDWPVLEHLDLSGNPLETLDVSGLSKLRTLSLRGTRLRSWPTGAEQLPDLSQLDLRDTQINDLPAAVLSLDRAVLDSNLAGAPLSAQAQADLAAAHQRIEQSWGLSAGALERVQGQPTTEVFAPEESASHIVRQLLPLLPPEPLDALPLPQRLQRLYPAIGEEVAGQWLQRLQREPLSDPQLRARILGWEHTHTALTGRLNDWIFTRPVAFSATEVATASSRRIAALRILDTWRDGLVGVGEDARRELSFHGLILGELPSLTGDFAHVERLNLTGVHLTEQASNPFLLAFAQTRQLVLSSNPLRALPEAVRGMTHLERLELSAVSIEDPEEWYAGLESLEHLSWLDLSYCDLVSLRINGMPRLQTLDLSNNELTFWPRGVLEAPDLHTLNLSNNPIEQIPPGLFGGDHDTLLAGTDLSNNFNLPREDLHRLLEYAERIGGEHAVGMRPADIQQLINEAEAPGSSDSDDGDGLPDLAPPLPDEVLDEGVTSEADRAPWLADYSPQEQASKRALWNQLEAEPDHRAFFLLLTHLQQTKDFELARASLKRRVWEVIEAMASDSELRKNLFVMSRSHATCSDGRILVFSGLETKAYETIALAGVDPHDLASRGEALLAMSRRLFRVGEMEKIAAGHIGDHRDAAEVRLKYLIGVKQRLDLPGVPEKMRYDTPVSGTTMDAAAETVLAAERSDDFYRDLISRDYWVAYLKDKYPQRFIDEQRRSDEQYGRLESAHQAVGGETYQEALNMHLIEQGESYSQLLIELSRLETGEPRPEPADTQQPGTSRNLMGN